MIHVRDQDFNALARDAFGEAFLTHTSTSPNQQLLASLDLARRQVDIEGFQLVRNVYDMALVFRHRVRKDRLISKWFRILDESDLVPDEFRAFSGQLVPSGEAGRAGGVERGVAVGPIRARPDAGHPVRGSDRHERIRLPREDPDGPVRHPDQQDLDQQRAVDLHHRRHLVERAPPARRVAPGGHRLRSRASGGQHGRSARCNSAGSRRSPRICRTCPTSVNSTSRSVPAAPARSATCGPRSTPGTRSPTASTSWSARPGDGSPRARCWCPPPSWCPTRPASRYWSRVRWSPRRSSISWPNSTSRKSTDTTPTSGCRCSPRPR